MSCSASQVALADSCLRKWGLSYLGAERQPKHASALKGNDFHTTLERWLRDAAAPPEVIAELADARRAELAAAHEEPPSASQAHRVKQLTALLQGDYAGRLEAAAMSAIRFLPPPKLPGMRVEGRFEFEDSGVRWLGYQDLVWERNGLRVLHDHKSTSSISRWAKTPEELEHDPQLVIYARREFQSWPEPRLECEWHYTEMTAKPRTVPVRLTVLREAIDQDFALITDKALALERIRAEGPDPKTLPYNEETCNAFGGCPYKGRECIIDPLVRIRGAFARLKKKDENMSTGFLARVQSKQQPALAPAPAPAVDERTGEGPSEEQIKAAIADASRGRPSLRDKLQAPPPSPGAQGVSPLPANISRVVAPKTEEQKEELDAAILAMSSEELDEAITAPVDPAPVRAARGRKPKADAPAPVSAPDAPYTVDAPKLSVEDALSLAIVRLLDRLVDPMVPLPDAVAALERVSSVVLCLPSRP